MNSEADQVHLLVAYPPRVALSSRVRSLKGVSSRLLRQERPNLVPHDWQELRWRPSYFAASCGGAPLTIIKPYVEKQQRPP
jgi:putative transposase